MQDSKQLQKLLSEEKGIKLAVNSIKVERKSTLMIY